MPSMWARVLVAWALEEVIDRHDLRRALRRAKRGGKLCGGLEQRWRTAVGQESGFFHAHAFSIRILHLS